MTIDVVIPVYNGERLVAEAVRSVLGQELAPMEVIVVDDGSTDGTLEALDPFCQSLRVIAHKTNLGLPAARNTGIANSKADLIAFLDADDVWLPTKLRKQVAVFQSRPDVGLCYTSVIECDVNLVPRNPLRRFKTRNGEWVFNELYLYAFPIPPSTVVVRRNVFDECGLFNGTMRKAQDYECWLRIAMRYPVSCISEALCKRRDNPESITRRASLEEDVCYGIRALELCAETASRLDIALPMAVAERKRLFLKRRFAQYADAGLCQQAEFYLAMMRESGGCGAMDWAESRLRLFRARAIEVARRVLKPGAE